MVHESAPCGETKKDSWPTTIKTLLAFLILSFAVIGGWAVATAQIRYRVSWVDRDNMVVDYRGQLYRLVPVEKKVEYTEPQK
jgi:hypothetical protein